MQILSLNAYKKTIAQILPTPKIEGISEQLPEKLKQTQPTKKTKKAPKISEISANIITRNHVDISV